MPWNDFRFLVKNLRVPRQDSNLGVLQRPICQSRDQGASLQICFPTSVQSIGVVDLWKIPNASLLKQDVIITASFNRFVSKSESSKDWVPQKGRPSTSFVHTAY